LERGEVINFTAFLFVPRIPMLRTHLLWLVVGALLVLIGACTSPRPVESSEGRPSAEEVARAAGEMAEEADSGELVLYSSSIDEDAADEPVEQEPVEQDPAEQEPVEQEPVEDEPGEDEPGEDEPGDQEPVDAGTSDAGSSDAGPAEQ
jgi:hypothetical protein